MGLGRCIAGRVQTCRREPRVGPRWQMGTSLGVLMPLPSVSGHVCPILTECTLAGRGPKPGCF